MVALLAAARDKRIAKLVLIAAPGKPGSDLILDQQRHALDLMKLPEAEREAKIELQKKIQAAVVAEKGWEGVPPELRAQADTAWFRSLLMFDPAKVMPGVRQPMLIVQGDRDTQVTPDNAEALAALARARKKGGAVEVRPSRRASIICWCRRRLARCPSMPACRTRRSPPRRSRRSSSG